MTSLQIADNLFSRYARVSRADASGSVVCICCGKSDHWGTFDNAHFVGRACMALRFSLDNCWPCHRACHDAPDHLTRYEATLIKARGEAFVEDLKARGKKYQKAPSEAEINELIEQLKQTLSEYGNQQSHGATDIPQGSPAVQGGEA